LWHIADIPTPPSFVCFWGRSGHGRKCRMSAYDRYCWKRARDFRRTM